MKNTKLASILISASISIIVFAGCGTPPKSSKFRKSTN